jgi:hypothetical protein
MPHPPLQQILQFVQRNVQFCCVSRQDKLSRERILVCQTRKSSQSLKSRELMDRAQCLRLILSFSCFAQESAAARRSVIPLIP